MWSNKLLILKKLGLVLRNTVWYKERLGVELYAQRWNSMPRSGYPPPRCGILRPEVELYAQRWVLDNWQDEIATITFRKNKNKFLINIYGQKQAFRNMTRKLVVHVTPSFDPLCPPTQLSIRLTISYVIQARPGWNSELNHRKTYI